MQFRAFTWIFAAASAAMAHGTERRFGWQFVFVFVADCAQWRRIMAAIAMVK